MCTRLARILGATALVTVAASRPAVACPSGADDIVGVLWTASHGNQYVVGWAKNNNCPSTPATVYMHINGRRVGQVTIPMTIEEPGIGPYRFVWEIPAPFRNSVQHHVDAFTYNSGGGDSVRALNGSPMPFTLGTGSYATPDLYQYLAGMATTTPAPSGFDSTPGYKYCASDRPLCRDTWKIGSQLSTILRWEDNWVGGPCVAGCLPGTCGADNLCHYAAGTPHVIDYNERTSTWPYYVGVHKNYDARTGGWRCFAQSGQPCGNAQYPPHATPIGPVYYPRLPGSAISNQGVTPGALLLPVYQNWTPFEWRTITSISATTCTDTSLSPPAIQWLKVHAFVADAVDFGCPVGSDCLGWQYEVLVLEEEQGSPPLTGQTNPPRWRNGPRLERYYFIKGKGRLMETGMELGSCMTCMQNPSCRNSAQSFLSCNAPYDGSGTTSFNRKVAGDLHQGASCPYPTPGGW